MRTAPPVLAPLTAPVLLPLKLWRIEGAAVEAVPVEEVLVTTDVPRVRPLTISVYVPSESPMTTVVCAGVVAVVMVDVCDPKLLDPVARRVVEPKPVELAKVELARALLPDLAKRIRSDEEALGFVVGAAVAEASDFRNVGSNV
jgi:hypothetical protein